MEDVVALRIALLGGTSLLGRDLNDHALSLGHSLTVFSRKPSADQKSYDQFKACEFDLVVNMIGGHRLALKPDVIAEILRRDSDFGRACASSQVPYVHLSSGAVFGPLRSPASYNADFGNPADLSPYGRLKVALEEQHKQTRALGSLVSDLRLFSFAGPELIQHGDYFISKVFESLVSGEEFVSNGNSFIRDFVGPAEILSALEILATSSEPGQFNLFSGQPASRAELLRSLSSSFGLKVFHSGEESEPVIYCSEPAGLGIPYNPPSSTDIVVREIGSTLSKLGLKEP